METYQLPMLRSDAFALGHRPAHLAERLLLELAHALARQAVLVANLLERPLLVVHQPEALAKDVGLDRLQAARAA